MLKSSIAKPLAIMFIRKNYLGTRHGFIFLKFCLFPIPLRKVLYDQHSPFNGFKMLLFQFEFICPAPIFDSPFNLVSGEDFTSPSREMKKVQRVDHADQNEAWNHYISSPRMISLLGHFMRKNELCHGFFLRWTNFYFLKSMNDLFWTEPILPMRSPLALNLKILT